MNDYRNILCAIDLDGDHNTSMTYALEFAGRFNSRIHLIYVNDPQAGYRHPTDREDAVALKVRGSLPASLLENRDIVYASSRGDTAEEIARYAKEHQIDLIVVGHKHRGKVYAAMFDSEDFNIIDAVTTPVLVIPEN